MKKIILLVAAALFGISASAQWYTGGSLGLDFSSNTNNLGDESKTVNKISKFNVHIIPQIGYNVNDKLAVGASLSLTPGSVSNSVEFQDPVTGLMESNKTSSASFTWAISPYVRYCFWSIKKFGIWGQAGIDLGTTTLNKTTAFDIGIYVLPLLTYDLNEKFTLLAFINAAQLSFDGQYGKQSSTTSFGFNAATNGQLMSIGFQYNF